MKIKISGIILSMALVLAITLGFVPGLETAKVVHASDNSGVCSQCGNIAWELDGTTLTISKAEGASSGEMCLACDLNCWNSYVSIIENIVIEEGVTQIASFAFFECSNLECISISESVTTIDAGAFSGCSSLTEIIIPSSVTSIDMQAFENCSSLESVIIPSGVTSIENGTFRGCSKLIEVIIPDSVSHIGDGAFLECSSLAEIVIPSTVTSIGQQAFQDCTSLTKIIIPAGVKSIEYCAFYGCESLASITFPEGLTSIGENAFYGCSGLTNLTIPNSVVNLERQAFVCENLTTVTIPCTLKDQITENNISFGWPNHTIIWNHLSPTYTTDDIADTLSLSCASCGNTYKTTLKAPEQTIYTGNPVEATCIGISEYFAPTITYSGINLVDGKPVHPGTYTATLSYGEYEVSVEYTITASSGVCSDCGNIAWDLNGTMLTVSKATGVTSGDMCDSCKEQWSDLNYTEVIVSSGVKSISDAAFNGCQSLKSVVISDGITNIGVGAFAYCENLSSAKMPCRLKEQIISNKVFLEANPTINYIHDTTTCIADDTKNTLTLTCTCSENAYVATLEAPTNRMYTGKPIVATCIGTSADFAPIITYSGNKLVDGKPVYPGTYTATLTYGDKKVSLQYTITEAAAPAKPYKITNVVKGVHVYWTAVDGVSKYGLWRSETGINGTYKWIANPTVAHFTDEAVESGKTYYYKVTTLDTVNNVHSAKSAAIGITYVATPDITSRVNQAAGVKLGWNKIAGATGYAIYRKPYSGNSAWERVATISGNSTFTWTDTSVKANNGAIYKYTIRALAGSDSKTLSGCRGAGRTMVRLTSRTLSSATKASATSIKCNWNTTAQATGYEIRFMVGNTVYKTYTVSSYKTGTKTFTGLKAGQTYKIQVRTYKKVDGVGTFYSAWSAAKTVSL